MRCAAVSLLFVALACEPTWPGFAQEPGAAPAPVAISAKTSDGSAVVGRVTAYDLTGFTLSPSPAGDGRGEGPPPGGQAVQFRWSQFDAGAASRIFERILADQGTGRQWLDAGRVLMGLPNGKNWAESAFLMALEKDASLKEDVAYAREGTTTVGTADATTRRRDDATRGGDEAGVELGEATTFIAESAGLSAGQPDVTEASLPDCSNIVNLRKVAANHFRFNCHNRIMNPPNWMIGVRRSNKMPDFEDARTFGHFCIKFAQTPTSQPNAAGGTGPGSLPACRDQCGHGKSAKLPPITFDVQAWNAPSDATALVSYIDSDTPEAFRLDKDGNETWEVIKASGVIDRRSPEDRFDLRTRFTFTPKKLPVWVAKSYPYSYKLHEAYMRQLADYSRSDQSVKVIEAARTDEDRIIHIVQIAEGTDEEIKDRPTVLIYAGEHATEHVAMRTALAMIDFLVSDTPEAADIRKKMVFLVMPMYDPDGAANGIFNYQTSGFVPQTKNKGVISLATWIGKWYDEDHRLDLAISLHNSKLRGNLAVQPAALWEDNLPTFKIFQKFLQEHLGELKLGTNPWRLGGSIARLCGWCEWQFETLYLGYEIGESSTLRDIREIGAAFVKSCGDLTANEAWAAVTKRQDDWRKKRQEDYDRMVRDDPSSPRRNRVEMEFFFMADYLRPRPKDPPHVETIDCSTPEGRRRMGLEPLQ